MCFFQNQFIKKTRGAPEQKKKKRRESERLEIEDHVKQRKGSGGSGGGIPPVRYLDNALLLQCYTCVYVCVCVCFFFFSML